MIYNIIGENIKMDDLRIVLFNKVIRETDGTYYFNRYYLAFINNNPIAVYINQKKYIHLVQLEKSCTQTEYLFKKDKLKYFDTIISTPKEIIDLSRNKEDFLNQNIKEITL